MCPNCSNAGGLCSECEAALIEKENERFEEGYMCAIDWQHEVGYASGGNRIYPSAEDLKRCHPMWASCGIVKVKISLIEWVEDQNLGIEDENEVR